MSTSATLPNTIQMRPSRLTGLVVGVAILTGVATWSVSQVATDSHATGTPKSDVVSTSGAATKAYVDGVVTLNPEQRAAMYGNVGLRTPYVGSVNALNPGLQAVDISRTPYVGSLNALNPEAQAGLQRAADLAAIADWARAEGLTGLSPTSLKPSAAPDAAIADWARAEGTDRPVTGVAEAERGVVCRRHCRSAARPARRHVRQRRLRDRLTVEVAPGMRTLMRAPASSRSSLSPARSHSRRHEHLLRVVWPTDPRPASAHV